MRLLESHLSKRAPPPSPLADEDTTACHAAATKTSSKKHHFAHTTLTPRYTHHTGHPITTTTHPHNAMSYEMDLALPVLKEPVDQMREGLKAGGFQSEATAPHPVQAFQATVRL